ncbi:MAG: alpha/beta fold hydrolase, partial [Nanoarchaeota archaeon]
MAVHDMQIKVDGEAVNTRLYNPEFAQDNIVLFCHGFPGSNRLVKLHEPLKDAGICLAEINFRGDPQSGGKFSFLGSIEDILQTRDRLRLEYKDTKLSALGYSYGGFCASNILAANPGRFDEVFLLNP